MYKKTVLENGIRVVTEAMPYARSISIGVVIEAGPRDESLEKWGLAHLTEHLMFQGTSSRDSMQIARLMDGAGGYMGGFTTRDYTYYSATVLVDYGTYVLDLLGDILLNSIFPEEGLQAQQEAILREIDGSYDIPDQRVNNLLRATRWPNHPLGRSLAGSHDSVKALTREDVIYFVHQNYLPNRITIAAAGDVDHEDFVAQVRDAFWRMMGSSQPTISQLSPHQGGIAIENMPVSQTYFSLGLKAYPYTHADRYGLHVINKLLGGGISSRLFRNIREDQGLVYYIGSEYLAYIDDGMLIIEGSTAPDYIQPVLKLILKELRQLFTWAEPVDEEELLIAKTHLRGQHIISGESTDTRMNRLATQELYFGRHISTEEIITKIDLVDEQVIQRIGQTLLTDALSQATLAIVGPEPLNHCDQDSLAQLLAESNQ